MKRNGIQKLRLNRETLRILETSDLGAAWGGAPIDESLRFCPPPPTRNCISINVGCTQALDTCPAQTIGIG